MPDSHALRLWEVALAAEEHLDSIHNLGVGELYNFETVVEMINEESGHDGEPELIENPAFDSVWVRVQTHGRCTGQPRARVRPLPVTTITGSTANVSIRTNRIISYSGNGWLTLLKVCKED